MKTARSSAKKPSSKGFRNLVVPLDFSPRSLQALHTAAGIALRYDSALHLMHVVEPPRIFNETTGIYAQWNKQVREGAEKELSSFINANLNDVIPFEAEVRLGRAHWEICALAKKSKADLIVISTHGRTGLKRLFLGSTAEKVIRNAPCSVLVLPDLSKHKDATSAFQPESILVPTDFSTGSEKALQKAIALATEFNASIQLLHVVPVHYATDSYNFIDYRILEAEMTEAGRLHLDRWSKKLAAKKIPYKTYLRNGRPSTEINELAKKLRADITVISTRNEVHTFFGLGSTTEEVIRTANCPTLVLRDKPG